jgi:SAM-dependent methyltransferase
MTEIKSGIRGLLARPALYELLQSLMGGTRGRERFVRCYLKPRAGDRIIDVGCGPAKILLSLQDVEYVGFDTNSRYIAYAQNRFGNRARFFAKELDEATVACMHGFDIALLKAVLHHLEDDQARTLIGLLRRAVKQGGRVVTLDNVFTSDQNPIARGLISLDRGRNVRTPEAYMKLAEGIFEKVECKLVHKRWPPYTHFIMTLS